MVHLGELLGANQSFFKPLILSLSKDRPESPCRIVTGPPVSSAIAVSRHFPQPFTMRPMNLTSRLGDALPEDRLGLLHDTAEICADHGVDLYLVGGTVRDILIGQPTDDLDIDLLLVGADESFPALGAAGLDGPVLSSSRFMTTKVGLRGVEVDLVRARQETYAHPGALPEVRPGSLDQDLARRDFSINAMAVALGPGANWGALIDQHDGSADLDRRIVRVLHPRSFADDPTRIFRAVRYAARLGFDLDPETARLLAEALPHVDALTGDRVRHEVERIFAEPRPADVLTLARERGVLRTIHPDFGADRAPVGRLPNDMPPTGPQRDTALLAALTWGASDAARGEIRRRLNMGSTWTRTITDLGGLADTSGTLGDPGLRRSQIHALLQPYVPEAVEAHAFLTDDAPIRERLNLYLDQLRHITPTLTGDDLIALGVPPGPEVGRLLGELRTALLDGELSTREDEERYVRERVGE